MHFAPLLRRYWSSSFCPFTLSSHSLFAQHPTSLANGPPPPVLALQEVPQPLVARPRVPAPRAAFVHQHPDFFVSPYLKVATPLENARIIAPVVVVGFYCLSENVVYSSHVYKCFWLV
ncbi:hypothetical protein EDB85DRAFT_2161620 [Lactarius pseudohatsudake]|nr:hypothetical protein EDB85DRAFT_2161620 [Lactarius pseudohatsudake]